MPNLPDKLFDGDLIKLSSCDNPLYIEFINTPGRGPAWRIYDRHGKGLLLNHEQAIVFKSFLDESLKPEYSPDMTDF